MTNEQIVEKIRSGCSTVKYMEMLYQKNLPLIKMFIKPYTAYEQEEDLLQEAYFGLLEAVNRYETSENVKFMTYASFWIRQVVRQYIENNSSLVRFPDHVYQKIFRYKSFVDNYYKDNGVMPSDKDVAKHFKITVHEVEGLKKYSQSVASLDEQMGNGDYTLQDTLMADFELENNVVDKLFDEQRKNDLWGIIERYTSSRELGIITGRFKNSKTLAELAKEQGVSRNRIRQIEHCALRKLGRGMAKRELCEKFEVISAGLYRTGTNDFKNTWESSVERIAIKKMKLEEILHCY